MIQITSLEALAIMGQLESNMLDTRRQAFNTDDLDLRRSIISHNARTFELWKTLNEKAKAEGINYFGVTKEAELKRLCK